MTEMHYAPRSLRKRGEGDSWEATLAHTNPLTGETVRTYHTIEARTRRQAEKRRDELILDLERKGGALASSLTLRDFLTRFVDYRQESGTIEPSTVRGYRAEAATISRYIGDVRLGSLTIADVNDFMARMSADGYAPKSVAKPFRLLKQALKWAQAQDLVAKNPCDFCKPPKRVKTPINALCTEDRTRMLRLAVASQPQPLGVAIELALTTGMRRGEVCALRWGDVSDADHSVTVRRALGNAEGGFYVKEPKTSSSVRTIPLTRHTWELLASMRAEATRTLAPFGLSAADAYILGTQEPESRPYNPTMLGKDFAAFCKMNGFKCTFHDLRHTFATMMIAKGVDVRTVASYLGHASVTMTLDTYADVDPDAKRAAVFKVEESFDMDFGDLLGAPAPAASPAPSLVFTVDQLEAMLAQARAQERQFKVV